MLTGKVSFIFIRDRPLTPSKKLTPVPLTLKPLHVSPGIQNVPHSLCVPPLPRYPGDTLSGSD